MLGGFDEDTNNTDKCEDKIIENTFKWEEMTLAPSNEPTQTTSPYQSNRAFILSYLGKDEQIPTLLLKRGDFVGRYKVNLIYLFPLFLHMDGVVLMIKELQRYLKVLYFGTTIA